MEIHKLEIKRQVFHALLGLVLVLLIVIGFLNNITLPVITLIGVFLSLASRKRKVPILHWFLKNFEREEDLKSLPGKGVLFYFVGALIVLILFPKDIALAAIMILALGDSVSPLFGKHFGKIRHPLSNKKFIEGSIAGFIAGALGAVVFVSPIEALLASFISMTAESVEIKIGARQIDDNVIVPFFAGLTIWIVRLF